MNAPFVSGAVTRTLPPPQRVYLAGPILGMTQGQASNWRLYVCEKLARHNITGISPLRCEPPPTKDAPTYKPTYSGDGELFGNREGIFAKNFHDTKVCDAALIYLPEPDAGKWPSIGTVLELGWAKAWGKTVILVTDSERMLAHPVVMSCASKHVRTIDEAVEYLIGLLGGYAGGKNV